MKSGRLHPLYLAVESPPPRAEWVEISGGARRPPAGRRSPPPRAEWVEIVRWRHGQMQYVGLRPHGRSGLKSRLWRFWRCPRRSLRPHGRSGLKYRGHGWGPVQDGLRPHGRSGLKFMPGPVTLRLSMSPPPRAEWVEILRRSGPKRPSLSPPPRAEWVEMEKPRKDLMLLASPPPRAEWVEIRCWILCPLRRARLRPHGRSGLKYSRRDNGPAGCGVSAPTGGVG